ncbi:MAG: YiiD C-terminal domain-containing protein [Bacteroidota bacterium]
MLFLSSALSGSEGNDAQPESWSELSQLRQVILDSMPVTRHLDFSLFRDAAHCLVATAPLAVNANHQQTAFGGSLSMLATIAGWAMMQLVLRERGCEARVVIQKSRISYRAPVCSDLVLRCGWPSDEKRAGFFDALERWCRARLPLRCTMDVSGEQAFVFDASYVAIAERSDTR